MFHMKHPPSLKYRDDGLLHENQMCHLIDEWKSTPTVTSECDAGLLPVTRESSKGIKEFSHRGC
ncbi:MAG: hypothetical protein HWN66_10770 [Candidatus Helarchaeota archaeon]|nr:hypothetical protein [Candidatus Helarchaeota archaeon]